MDREDVVHKMVEHGAVYSIDGGSVIALVSQLIQLVLGLVSPEQAKALLDQETVRRANALADAVEVARFGKTSSAQTGQTNPEPDSHGQDGTSFPSS